MYQRNKTECFETIVLGHHKMITTFEISFSAEIFTAISKCLCQ